MADLFQDLEDRLDAASVAIQAKIDALKAQIDAGGMTSAEEADAHAKLDALVAKVEALGQ